MSDKDDQFKARLGAALDHGIDITGRRIFLHAGVDEDSIGTAIRGLYLLSDHDPTLPIELFVSSYGGELEEAFALHDVTRTIQAPVHTCALGKCMSAAPILVACGKLGERWATENSQFMLHDTQIVFEEGDSDNPDNIIANAQVATKMMDSYAKLMARYTKKNKRFWKTIFAKKVDKFFGAEEALEWGIIDGIWSEK